VQSESKIGLRSGVYATALLLVAGGAGVGVAGGAGVAAGVDPAVDVDAVVGPSGTPFEHAAADPSRPTRMTNASLVPWTVLTRYHRFNGTCSPVERMPASKPLSARYRSYCTIRPVPAGNHNSWPCGVTITLPEKSFDANGVRRKSAV